MFLYYRISCFLIHWFSGGHCWLLNCNLFLSICFLLPDCDPYSSKFLFLSRFFSSVGFSTTGSAGFSTSSATITDSSGTTCSSGVSVFSGLVSSVIISNLGD
eukprot:sb/3478410/